MLDENRTMPRECADLFETLKNQVKRLYAKWIITKQLFAHSQERIDLLSQTAPSFFRIISFVLRDDLFVSISRITDPAKRSSLNRLVKILKQHTHSSFYGELNMKMSEINAKVEPIRKWRNKRIAHLELPPDHNDDPEALPSVTRETIEDSLNQISALMNDIEGYFEKPEFAYSSVSLRGDGDHIVYMLSKYQDYRNEKKQLLFDTIEQKEIK